MKTEVEWRQINDLFSIMKRSPLSMETEVEWRQMIDPFFLPRRVLFQWTLKLSNGGKGMIHFLLP